MGARPARYSLTCAIAFYSVLFSCRLELQPISTFPEDLEDEELAAYAEEYELHLEDIHPDQLFSLSDVDDVVLINEVADESHQGKGKCKEIATKDEDFDMTV